MFFGFGNRNGYLGLLHLKNYFVPPLFEILIRLPLRMSKVETRVDIVNEP